MSEDLLITCLTRLCKRFSDDPLQGRYQVAAKAKLSEQYLYQILASKPMAGGSARSIGKVARGKLTKAFPDWLDTNPGEIAYTAAEPSPPPYLQPSPLEAELLAVARKMTDRGLHILINEADKIARQHPRKKKEAA